MAQQHAKRLPQQTATLCFSHGFEGGRRNNICYIAEKTLMHTCGGTIHFLNLETKTQAFLPSVSGLGIGAVAIHPSRRCFAVCEKGLNPSIFIYEYPTLDVTKVLKQGTENVFTAASFNHDGTQLAAVGGHPDFSLTVWDWSNESMILRAKAFSQEVFNVTFSKFFNGQLITSGVGHIRFWRMASTFTGLKLEGFIGKFGQVSLSDIAGYVELSNGKVLCGTESGSIIVWEGGLIKCQLKKPGGAPCHAGMIEIVLVDDTTNQFVTAGFDGYVRFWNLEWLDAAADGDEKLICEVNPLRELQVEQNCQIKGFLFQTDHWIIQDEGGALWKVNIASFELEQLLEFHAGAIAATACSPNSYYFATAGSDGTVRLYHFKQHKQIYYRRFSSGATAMIWLSLVVDPKGITIAIGFRDGVLRVLQQSSSKWRLVHASKPHTMDVVALCTSPNGELLATASMDATIFFFECSKCYKPRGFVKMDGPITCMDWSPNGNQLLVGCKNGAIFEVACPDLNVDTRRSFELSLPIRSFVFKLPKTIMISPQSGMDTKNQDISATSTGVNIEIVLEGEGIKEPKGDIYQQTEGHMPSEDYKSDESSLINDDQKQDKKPKSPIKSEKAQISLENNMDGFDDHHIESSFQVSAFDRQISLDKLTDASSKEAIFDMDDVSPLYPVCALVYSHSNLNTFYVALHGERAGSLYECHIDSTEVLGHTDWHTSPVQSIRYTQSFQYLVSGAADGVVRIQTAPVPGQLSLSGHQEYWQAHIHDSFTGKVGGAAISYDNKYLASVAYDGSFFIYELDLKPSPQIIKDFDLTSIIEDFEPEAEDIGIGVYSIEEDKQKTEQDNKLKLALEKKVVIQGRVDNLRKLLATLLKENSERSPSERLSIAEFEIDPNMRMLEEVRGLLLGRWQWFHQPLHVVACLLHPLWRTEDQFHDRELRQGWHSYISSIYPDPRDQDALMDDLNLFRMVEDEIQAKVENARSELLWEIERKNIALSKLKHFFLDTLEVEHIVLHAFQTQKHVCSFRTEKTPTELQDYLKFALLEADVYKEAPSRHLLNIISASQQNIVKKEKALVDETIEATKDDINITTKEHLIEKTQLDLYGDDNFSKQELRRIKMKEREKEYIEFLHTKPDESYVNPEDLEAIQKVQANKGDFKLKTDLNHIMPKEQQTNAKSKRREMLMLYKDIHKEKMAFNTKFLALRSKKRKLTNQILQCNSRIMKINYLLKIKDEHLFVPIVFKDETPEDREEISMNDVEEYLEKTEVHEPKNEDQVETLQPGNRGAMGFGLPGKQVEKTEEVGFKEKLDANFEEKQTLGNNAEVFEPIKITFLRQFPPSNLEQAEHEAIQIRLKFEKFQLQENMNLLMRIFDKNVEDLRHQRFQLEINIKRAELKMLVLYQELRLLQRFQPQEETLELRHTGKLVESQDITVKLLEQDRILEQKEEELNSLNENKKKLLSDFEELIEKSSPQWDILHKIYQRKVKRATNETDITNNSEDFDLEEMEGSDDDVEEDNVGEICPPGCDEAIYQMVRELREKRLEQDDLISESTRQLETIQREKESRLKKRKAIDAALQSIERDMEEFQKEKQNALNQIDIVLSLYMNQVEYVVDGKMSEELSGALVFGNSSLKNLKATIQQHVGEKVALRQLQKELRNQHSALVRERRANENKAAELEQRVIDVQMLKFGQVIDLDVIDSMRVQKTTLDLKEHMKTQEAHHAFELDSWDQKINHAIDELAIAMKKNAALLNVIADVKEKQSAIEQTMRAKATTTFRDPLIEKKRDVVELARLKQVVNVQAKQIENLAAELRVLHRDKQSIFP